MCIYIYITYANTFSNFAMLQSSFCPLMLSPKIDISNFFCTPKKNSPTVNAFGGGDIIFTGWRKFLQKKKVCVLIWLVVSTHLKNISQIGSFPQVGVKIKNIWNHHLVMVLFLFDPYTHWAFLEGLLGLRILRSHLQLGEAHYKTINSIKHNNGMCQGLNSLNWEWSSHLLWQKSW